ncbi:unnamed protein product [Brassicogethes aeneus]|uniref:Uncharacterized protein n=1 Tax=Brassicogethes aeneus TaxID=1431903 RepID=A0A9P0FBP1_BRAAE|nr:unnamed protein product [Brassicogethes aeneus]
MERIYNFFMVKYYNAHHSIKTKPIYPVLNVCPGRLTRHEKQDDSIGKFKLSTINPRESLWITNKLSETVDILDYSEDSNIENQEIMYGNLEIKIMNVMLSETCIQQLAKSYGKHCTIFFKWKFLNQSKTTTPYESIQNIQGFIINFTIRYKVLLNGAFYKFLVKRLLPVELCACNKYKEDIIGVGLYSLQHCLENVGNMKVSNLTIDDRHNQIVYAQLKIGSQLDADNEIVQIFRAKYRETGYKDKAKNTNLDSLKIKQQLYEDDIAIHDTLNTVLTRSNCLKISRSEISNELRERVEYLHQECNWKRTLQEHAILKGEDPFAVNDQQWRTKETEHIKLRTFSPTLKSENCELIITIETVRFNTNSFVMRDDHINKIYVEYEFLSHKGQEFETPYSINKSEKIFFNFQKRFPFHMVINSCDCKLLAECIKTGKNINFAVVGEPKYKPETPTLCCIKLAFCSIPLLDLVEAVEDEVVWKCELINIRNLLDIVGTLSVKFQGLLSLRRTALKMLAPPEYDLI